MFINITKNNLQKTSVQSFKVLLTKQTQNILYDQTFLDVKDPVDCDDETSDGLVTDREVAEVAVNDANGSVVDIRSNHRLKHFRQWNSG